VALEDFLILGGEVVLDHCDPTTGQEFAQNLVCGTALRPESGEQNIGAEEGAKHDGVSEVPHAGRHCKSNLHLAIRMNSRIPTKFPADWCDLPEPASTRAFGDALITSVPSALLCVPSGVTLGKFNYLFTGFSFAWVSRSTR